MLLAIGFQPASQEGEKRRGRGRLKEPLIANADTGNAPSTLPRASLAQPQKAIKEREVSKDGSSKLGGGLSQSIPCF